MADTHLPRTITIYSVGLLGASLGLAFKRSGYTGTILGLSSPAAISTALDLGCIDEGYGYDQIQQVARRTDLLFLCSPIDAIIKTLRHLGTINLPAGIIITDIGSTKREIVAAARESLPGHAVFIGGHPMAGSEKSGPAQADPFLFQNAVYVLTTATKQVTESHRMLSALFERFLGCKCMTLDPDVHDTIAATVSHVPHLLAVALANLAGQTAQNNNNTLELAAGGFRDMTRIASAPYAMWHDIISTNRDIICGKLDEYAAILTAMRERVMSAELGGDFAAAAKTRASVPLRAKGLVGPLNDIVVAAPDQPGAIAAIANTLSAESINIKDIEVLRVREGEAGTIRLAFDSPATSRRAVAALATAGFSARVRE